MPATDGRGGPRLPGVAHVFAVFVLPPWWGRGVAPRLLDAVVEGMRERGYARGRLFTPERQARARAFYAREGWTETRTFHEPELGFDLVELVREV